MSEVLSRFKKEPLDFREITRNADKACTALVFDDMSRTGGRLTHTFLLAGECRIRTDGRHPWLDAYLGRGATDFEEDSAFAFRIPLLSISFIGTRGSVSEFTAVIDPRDPEEIRLPGWGYNPFNLAGTRICEDCDPHHPIVPEGHYIGPHDPEIAAAVAGRTITIVTGPKWDRGENDG